MADKISEDAIIINNQLSDYPNKELSGVWVTWQFCRYIDKLNKTNFAEKYYDLVALGNMADMMSLKSIETKHLILKGFKEENIINLTANLEDLKDLQSGEFRKLTPKEVQVVYSYKA